MMKRLKELEAKEADERQRLSNVKARLEAIAIGAADCDGYTSNTEEATFIVKPLLLIHLGHLIGRNT